MRYFDCLVSKHFVGRERFGTWTRGFGDDLLNPILEYAVVKSGVSLGGECAEYIFGKCDIFLNRLFNGLRGLCQLVNCLIYSADLRIEAFLA